MANGRLALVKALPETVTPLQSKWGTPRNASPSPHPSIFAFHPLVILNPFPH